MKKVFLNTKTGEVIFRKTRLSAVRYFKVDGKALGIKIKNKDILSADGIIHKIGEVYREWLAEQDRKVRRKLT